MSYNKIIKNIAKENGVSVKEVKTEMQHALSLAGINIPAKTFIEIASREIKKTIYSKSYNL